MPRPAPYVTLLEAHSSAPPDPLGMNVSEKKGKVKWEKFCTNWWNEKRDEQFGAEGFGDEEVLSITMPVETMWIRKDLTWHMIMKEKDARERYANFVLPTLKKPFEVYAAKYSDGTIRNHYIGLFQGEKNVAVIVLKTPEGGLMWNILKIDGGRLNKKRVGELIYKR